VGATAFAIGGADGAGVAAAVAGVEHHAPQGARAGAAVGARGLRAKIDDDAEGVGEEEDATICGARERERDDDARPLPALWSRCRAGLGGGHRAAEQEPLRGLDRSVDLAELDAFEAQRDAPLRRRFEQPARGLVELDQHARRIGGRPARHAHHARRLHGGLHHAGVARIERAERAGDPLPGERAIEGLEFRGRRAERGRARQRFVELREARRRRRGEPLAGGPQRAIRHVRVVRELAFELGEPAGRRARCREFRALRGLGLELARALGIGLVTCAAEAKRAQTELPGEIARGRAAGRAAFVARRRRESIRDRDQPRVRGARLGEHGAPLVEQRDLRDGRHGVGGASAP
jgi:hypothetical protein